MTKGPLATKSWYSAATSEGGAKAPRAPSRGAVGGTKATATTHPLHLQSHHKLMEGTRGADGVEVAELGGGGRR